MLSQKQVDKILQNHEKRLLALESKHPSSFKSEKSKTGNKPTLSGYILNLREKLFTQPRTADEVHAGLKGIYHCDISRVKVELLRMSKRKQLRVTSKTVSGKKYKAYVW